MVSEKEMRAKTQTNIGAARKLRPKLNKWMKTLGMSDWNIVLACDIDETNDDKMDVETDKCEYKKAKLTVYKIKPSIEADLIHELLHLKIGLLTGAYKKALEKQHETIQELIDQNEERVVTDMEIELMKHYGLVKR